MGGETAHLNDDVVGDDVESPQSEAVCENEKASESSELSEAGDGADGCDEQDCAFDRVVSGPVLLHRCDSKLDGVRGV